jgi:methanogenic corrinoid protein MtbC1
MYLLREVVNSCVDPADLTGAIGSIDAAIAGITSAVRGKASQITVDSLYKELASEYLAALLSGDRHKAQRLIHSAVESGTGIRDIYLQVFQPAQHEVGHMWQTNRISVADEHFCTAATQSIMIDLYPKIISSHRIGKTLVAACVGSELHEIGIRMVADFFEMEGWDTYYIGAGARHDEIIAAVKERKADLLALSATMTYHVDTMQTLIRLVRTRANAPNLKIMVGGLPFNSSPALWQEVGADFWAPDAEQALQIISQQALTET